MLIRTQHKETLIDVTGKWVGMGMLMDIWCIMNGSVRDAVHIIKWMARITTTVLIVGSELIGVNLRNGKIDTMDR